ncbi:DUF6551 family protein [Romboutsia sp.]|uniref:DUF6551 family protein n=1 Tax=Romboutsia sp. TaxID=1965302 RepID=UPI002BA5EB17|nr:DUF6551 family protein [Romboutsia sp.]HSQ87990.1 DUF6551 family protein [Romboutsia sp.]
MAKRGKKEKGNKENEVEVTPEEVKVEVTPEEESAEEEIATTEMAVLDEPEPEVEESTEEPKEQEQEESEVVEEESKIGTVQDIQLSGKMDEKIRALKNKVFNMNDFGLNMWLDVNQLLIDEETQRGIMTSQVERIIRDFNPSSFGRITVSKRDDGYYVVNGQHRLMALKKIGVRQAPCIVIENPHAEEVDKKKQDAINFLEINQNSQAVRAIDKFRIGVSAQLPDWLAVRDVIEENGLRAGTTVNSVNCLACIHRYINSPSNIETKNAKKKQISKAIKILNETVGVPHITHISLQAMCILVREYVDNNLTTVDKMITRFSRVELAKLISTAITMKNNGTSKNIVSTLAFLLVQEYNNKCRRDDEKLPIDRLSL